MTELVETWKFAPFVAIVMLIVAAGGGALLASAIVLFRRLLRMDNRGKKPLFSKIFWRTFAVFAIALVPYGIAVSPFFHLAGVK